jgi:hypothetical protein
MRTTGGALGLPAIGLAMALASQPVAAQSPTAGSCTKADFEAVVDEAAGALRDLNQSNKPTFQEKLRLLKDKRGWSHDEFLKAAAPFVQDDRIRDYDQRSNELLDKITAMGQEGSTAKAPDCALLSELHGNMKALVEAQQAKWTYMFGKLDAELTK